MRLIARIGVAAALLLSMIGPARATTDVYAIDGDTVRVGQRTVRLLGIDTPERFRCGYSGARAKMASLIAGGVKLRNRSGKDRYGRTLAYLRTRDGRDVGAVMIRSGWAIARYDSLDGYPAHPKQQRYRRLDAAHDRRGVCVP